MAMRSQSSFSNFFPNIRFHPSRTQFRLAASVRFSSALSPRHLRFNYCCASKLTRSCTEELGFIFRCGFIQVKAMDEDSLDISALDDWKNEWSSDSDTEILVNPITDVDLPSINDPITQPDDALRVATHRLAMLGRGRKKSGSRYGVLNNAGLIAYLVTLLLLVDWCAWRIVRLPLAPFYLTRPFFISAALVFCAGHLCIPLLDSLKIHHIQRAGPLRHLFEKRTPTMGGIFFVPIGILVAEVIVGFSSTELSGAAVVTLAFATIGLLHDAISLIKNHNYGLSATSKFFLEVAVAARFSFWLDAARLSTPYGMKMLVPLPAPLGLIYLGKFYFLLTSFCLILMGNGVNLADGVDGLAAGTAAFAFIGMAIAVLPICADLAIFGASMSGACVGFLFHNRYRASVVMGYTGALALGGALASMAACTGMFFPAFISAGIFVLEASSVVLQVLYFKTTKHIFGAGRHFFRKVPFHHHLGLCGIKEPMIVAGAYFVSCILATAAGYVGLVSA